MSEVLNQENGSFSKNWRNVVHREWREAKCRRAIIKNRTGKRTEKEKEDCEGCWKEESTGPAEGWEVLHRSEELPYLRDK